MKRKILPIGTVVIVHTAVDNPVNYRIGLKPLTEINLNPPVMGQIVGGTYLAVGEYHIPSYSSDSYLEDDAPYIAVDKMVFVYLVRLGFTNKPVKVLPKEVIKYQPFGFDFLFELPFRKAQKVKWSEKDRAYLRDIMKSVSRDSKGRWLK